MRPALEDIFMGPLASPSFSHGFRWEDSRRRVRVVFGGVIIADSTRVMLLHEFGRLPVFYFPIEDVRVDLMEATEHHTSSPLKGEASYWTIRVGERIAENAIWSYLDPLPGGPQLEGYVAFYWEQMDDWYEEASYWSARVGEKIFKDIVWSYLDPLPACLPIARYLCFFNERVDAIYVDDELQSTPKTIWSE